LNRQLTFGSPRLVLALHTDPYPQTAFGPGWVHEIKHDGHRLIVRRVGKTLRLFTRRGYDWTDCYPGIAATAFKLRAKSFTLDGEVMVCGSDGIAVFDALHRRRGAADAVLQGFDLELNGEDLRPLPFEKRKAKLARLARINVGIALNEHTQGRSWTDSTRTRWYHRQLVLDAVDNRCVGTYMGPMMHDDVHKFVARSEAEWRAHIAAAIEAAREPWDRGEVVEPDRNDELVEVVSVPPRRQRKRSLAKVCEAARKAGADRVIVDGIVIALSPSAAVPVPESNSNEWDTVLSEEDHGPH
jgi:hypothetical protein